MADEPTQELSKNVGNYGGAIVAIMWTLEKVWVKLVKREEKADDETTARMVKAEKELAEQREAERHETRRMLTAVEASMTGFASSLGEMRADIRMLSPLPAEVAALRTDLAAVKERMNAALASHASDIDNLKDRLKAVEMTLAQRKKT